LPPIFGGFNRRRPPECALRAHRSASQGGLHFVKHRPAGGSRAAGPTIGRQTAQILRIWPLWRPGSWPRGRAFMLRMNASSAACVGPPLAALTGRRNSRPRVSRPGGEADSVVSPPVGGGGDITDVVSPPVWRHCVVAARRQRRLTLAAPAVLAALLREPPIR